MSSMSLQDVLIFSLIIVFVQQQGLDCYYWSSSLVDGAVKHACAGDDVIFPWKVTLGPEEHLLAVQWTFQGRANEIVAMLHSGRFLPMSSYNGRVRRVAEEGLSLSGVTAGDSGLYTVVVTVQNTNGDTVTIRHKVDLHVRADDDVLVSDDGNLHVTQEPLVVYNNATHHWSMELKCGDFGYQGAQPAFDVEWVLPSGAVQPSAFYDKGAFHLLLANPVTGGSYKCRLPARPAAALCASSNSRSGREASTWVEEVRARLAVLEAEEGTLLADTDSLKVRMDLVTQRNAQLAAGHLPKAEANVILHAADAPGHRLDQTPTHDSGLLEELQNLQTRVNQTSGQLSKQTDVLSQKVEALQQRMERWKGNQRTMGRDSEWLREQVEGLKDQDSQLTAHQQTFESKMTRAAVDLEQRMNNIVRENTRIKQQFQTLQSQMISSPRSQQTSPSSQENAQLSHQQAQHCQTQIDRFTQRLGAIENSTLFNEPAETKPNHSQKVVDFEKQFKHSTTQLSHQLNHSTTQLSKRLEQAEEQLRSVEGRVHNAKGQVLEELNANFTGNDAMQTFDSKSLGSSVGLLERSARSLLSDWLWFLRLPRNCVESKRRNRRSGTVLIRPLGQLPLTVYCDQDTDGGGWTVFQRRVDGSENFLRNWNDYQRGFGNMNREFWLGLDDLNRLTSTQVNELRVDLEDWEGGIFFALYSNFSIADGSDNYRLHYDRYIRGTAGNSLMVHNDPQFITRDADNDLRPRDNCAILYNGNGLRVQNDQQFTTRDDDNDMRKRANCAILYNGAWWYRRHRCHTSHLNGIYTPGGAAAFRQGVQWLPIRGNMYSLKTAEMKFRPTSTN